MKKELKKLTSMSTLKFNDGIKIDTSGDLRKLKLYDGWYVTGKGYLIPVANELEAEKLIKDMGREE